VILRYLCRFFSWKKILLKAFLSLHLHLVILFWTKNRQLATQLSKNGIFCHKFPIFEKKIAKKRQKTGFSGMVLPHLCLLTTVFKGFKNKFAS
jgi:hypothetical protein